ncbi:MAG: c-type heme family protein [Planctomycetota bacterium]|jgi:hypothetical protein
MSDRPITWPGCARRAALHLAGFAILVACAPKGGKTPTASRPPTGAAGWTAVSEEQLSPAQEGQRQEAVSARDEMFGRLLSRLTAAIGEHGAAGAIGVCRDDAPRIAATVSSGRDLRIGRTAPRLRNPANVAPDWAHGPVAARAEEPAYRAGPDGELGVLLPIRLLTTCVLCHGAEDELAPGVRAALAEAYPRDRATGFAPGDLRGWFWVEVPARVD